MTIATFNVRAQCVVEGIGFRTIGRFQAATDGRSYELLVRPEPGPSPWGKVNCGE
jgi:[ribosomal protein S18]-alanine N-acetyltransferase